MKKQELKARVAWLESRATHHAEERIASDLRASALRGRIAELEEFVSESIERRSDLLSNCYALAAENGRLRHRIADLEASLSRVANRAFADGVRHLAEETQHLADQITGAAVGCDWCQDQTSASEPDAPVQVIQHLDWDSFRSAVTAAGLSEYCDYVDCDCLSTSEALARREDGRLTWAVQVDDTTVHRFDN